MDRKGSLNAVKADIQNCELDMNRRPPRLNFRTPGRKERVLGKQRMVSIQEGNKHVE